MKYKAIILFLALLGFVSAYFSFFSIHGNMRKRAGIRGIEFDSETVYSSDKKTLGLGGRKSLCQSCAMLFVFPRPGKYGFGMKDMNFDLDIIWIKENKITEIAKSASRNNPDLIMPGMDSDKVLEINSGLSDKFGFKEGDEVKIK